MIPIKAASLNCMPRLIFFGSITVPLWYPLWQVSHSVIRLFGALPPVLRLSIWWTFNILSLDLPLQHWQVCPSRKNTYSRTFQKSICSPCWYSIPWISGFLIFWISKEAVSTIIWLIGRILQTFATTVRCDPIFCRIDGASHPSFRFRLSNLAGRYLVFLLRLLRRSCLLVASSFTISSRNSTSDSYNTFAFVVADIPICLLPASTPNDTGCTFLSDSYCSCMVNGHFFMTFAIPDRNIRQTFPCRSVGINGCPSFATTYTMI